MRIFHDAKAIHHDPTQFFRRGTLIPHPEQASRYTVLRDALDGGDHQLVQVGGHGLDPILAVHEAGYVAFLRDV